jgi:hypothetical protein
MSNSLFNSLDIVDYIDSIKLALKSKSGQNFVFILVEGITDCSLYRKYFDTAFSNIEYIPEDTGIDTGKEGIRQTLSKLDQNNRNIIAICDADFDHLDNIPPFAQNVFLTDKHDSEMTMLGIPNVFKNLLITLGFTMDADTLLENILSTIEMVGYIKWMNVHNNIGLTFKNVNINNTLFTVTSTNFNFDFKKYKKIIERKSNKTIAEEDVLKFKIDNDTKDYFNLCNGHDVIDTIYVVLNSMKPLKMDIKTLAKMLRATFSINDFSKTQLYANICRWQRSAGYPILNNL